jgi:hypothetical protein
MGVEWAGKWLGTGQPVEVRHRNNLPWYDAPLPRRWHRCRPQTDGWLNLTRVQRCACGAIRDVYRGRWSCWVWKNTRRETGREHNPEL